MEKRGVALRITKQNIDTGTSEGKLFLTMLAGFSEFETVLRKERQLEGIAKAKAAGKYKGRPVTHDREEIARLLEQGLNKSQVARQMGCDVRTVRRIANELKEKPAEKPSQEYPRQTDLEDFTGQPEQPKRKTRMPKPRTRIQRRAKSHSGV